jgi:hypothetical protein
MVNEYNDTKTRYYRAFLADYIWLLNARGYSFADWWAGRVALDEDEEVELSRMHYRRFLNDFKKH